LRFVAAHANSKLPKEEWIHLHAHKVRHTGVKTTMNGGHCSGKVLTPPKFCAARLLCHPDARGTRKNGR
jgi:hypothetical protein